MRFYFHIATFFTIELLCFHVQAQLAGGSPSVLRPDSVVAIQLNKMDSIRKETETDYLRFKSQYDSINQTAGETRSKLQSKIDSLTALNLPTLGLSQKLDSAGEANSSKLKELESKWEDTKSKHTSGIA